MNTIHSAADVARALAGDESMKECEGLNFATGRVKKRCTEDIHALHIYCGLVGDTRADC